jgi:RNA polymerase sigma-70 factor (ECF subfamily)
MAEQVSDAILLKRFVSRREEAAFVALVRRHGPLVQAICRRILHNEHDVEDVFQATFLVLARKAGGIPWRDSVGGWLGAVAHRLALNARAGVSRRRGRETPMAGLVGSGPRHGDEALPEDDHPVADPLVEVERRDLRRVLDDELLQLPEKYRAPMVLCYLEGRTHQEAARQLGWPAGSMSRRLERARTLLRRRLAHRGLALALIGVLSTAFAATSLWCVTHQHDGARVVVRGAMTPFKPPSEGGRGLGHILSTIVRTDQPPRESEQAMILAREAAGVAARIEPHDPGEKRDEWRKYAVEMQLSALQLAQATQENDSIDLLAAARRLDASCLKCHEVFRQ